MSFHELPRATRLVLQAAGLLLVLGLAGIAFYSCVLDTPERNAARAFEGALSAAKRSEPEAALRTLDAVMAGEHRANVSSDLEERVGAEIVRITASLVPEPITKRQLDQVGRLVRRYQALTNTARDGAARDVLLTTLDRWAATLDKPDEQEAKLAVLRYAAGASDTARSAGYSQRIAATRATAGAACADRAPIYALEILMGEPHDAACIAKAGQILSALVGNPSLLDDGARPIEQWLAATPESEPLRKVVADALARGKAAHVAVEAADEATLPPMIAKEPWNQHAVVKLARTEIDAGAVSSAEARLRALGPPIGLIREARQILAELALRGNDLVVADELFTGLLESRLLPFQEASQAFERAFSGLQQRFENQLRTGDVPPALATTLQGASQSQQQAAVLAYFKTLMDSDPDVKRAQEAMVPFQDVIPLSISAGMAKIRRAQTAVGAARDEFLADAERTFLAVRTQAEGQPVFHLGLGEVYARLGKTAESDAELERVLVMKDPSLTLQVAHVYRGIGSDDRAKKLATSVFDTASPPIKSDAALFMSLMTEASEDEHEQWLRKADQNHPFVKTSLLELEARRLLRRGKHVECDQAYAQVAKAHLATASAADVSAYNNAAIAHQGRFMCTGDPQALRDAEATLDRAYRTAADNSIVVINFASLLESDAFVRTLAKHVDIRILRPGSGDAETLIDTLLQSSERDAILAELASDAGWRRSGELYAQLEVLAPNSAASYRAQLERASRLRNESAARATIERLRKIKGLDVSSVTDAFQNWVSGKADPQFIEGARSSVARMGEVLKSTKLDPKTRAAALVIQADALQRLGVYWDGAEALSRSRIAYDQATKLWPAVVSSHMAPPALVDEIAVAIDAKRWASLRRRRGAASVLDTLIAERDALGSQIVGSPQWKQIPALLKAVTERPGLAEVRLSRIAADPVQEARFKSVFDDTLLGVRLEGEAITMAGTDAAKEELEYFRKH
jgi:hypothetical protein